MVMTRNKGKIFGREFGENKSIVGLLFLALSIFMVQSCAKIGKPSGGPIDKTGPKILRTSIPNGSINVQTKQITLCFDEFVVLNNPSKHVTVSPPLQYPLSFRLKGKHLIMSWEDTLKPSTTYVFDLDGAVKDLHEGNVLENYVFAFSTGAFLDTLSLYGRLLDAKTLKPLPDIFVALYDGKDDSSVFKRLPEHITRSDAQGYYSFMFLDKKSFRLFAYSDDNQNFRYDLLSEKFAFKDSLVTPVYYNYKDSSKTVEKHRHLPNEMHVLKVYTPLPERQGVKSDKLLDPGRWQIVLQRPADRFSVKWITPEWNESDYYVKWNKGQDTVDLYTWHPSETGEYKLVVFDGATFSDTLQQKNDGAEAGNSKNKIEHRPGKVILKTNLSKEHPYFQDIVLSINEPVQYIDTNKILKLCASDDTVALALKIQPDHRSVKLLANIQDGRDYKLLVPDSLFFGNENRTHDSLNIAFRTTKDDDYGAINIRLESTRIPLSSLVLFLSDSKNNSYYPVITREGNYLFEHLSEGSYTLKIWHDQNENKRWDVGDYWQNRLPETVMEYPKTFSVRAGWEISETWVVP